MKYDVDYFIKKFEAIPEDKWCIIDFLKENGQMCALGHCGVREVNNDVILPEEATNLISLFGGDIIHVTSVNDCYGFNNFKTPKHAILAKLNDIKNRG